MNQSIITSTVNELMARQEGASVREVMAACAGSRKAVQACFQRRKDEGLAHVRAGIDGGGIRCHRYFSTPAAAEAYVFVAGYYQDRENWKNAASAQYSRFVTDSGPTTYAECARGMGLTFHGAARSIGRMVARGVLFTARKTDMATRRPVLVLFASAQARDEWQSANPYTMVGRNAQPPKPRAPKQPKPSRGCKKSTTRSALSPVKRFDKGVAEILSSRSRKAFAVQPKPPEYKLTSADLEKRVIVSGHPGYDMRYQCPPTERVIGGFASMRPGQYLDGVAA